MKTLNKQERVALGVALVAAAILFFGGQIWNIVFGTNEQNLPTSAPTSADATATTTKPQVITMKNISTTKGLEIYDEQVGTGTAVKSGQTVTAHYIGYLTDGTKFDSSVDRQQPLSFVLGAGKVIKGWDQGIVGMKIGGIRRLVIAPELAYGSRAIGPIPANATLIFEVQLLGVK